MSVNKLKNILESREYIVKNTLSLDGIDKFLYIEYRSCPLLIDIFKYSVKSDSSSIKIDAFNDISIPKKYENPFIDRDIVENTDSDSVLEMYQNIDIESDEIENLKDSVSISYIQLQRIKYLTEKHKYKCCILSNSYFICENTDSTIQSYIFKSSINQSIGLSIDVDSFYTYFEKEDKCFIDIYNTICKKIYSVTSSVFKNTIDYKNIERIVSSFKKSISSYKTIKKYNDLIKKVKLSLSDMECKISSLNNEYSKLTDTSDSSVYRRIQIDKDINKLKETRELLNKKYSDIYGEYISLLIVFENDIVNKKIFYDSYKFISDT